VFISHTTKILFFEVPRTASRSITGALTRLDPRSPTAVVRAVKRNMFGYHEYDADAVRKYSNYRLIAVHRNPYDRILSHYNYRHTHGNPDILKTLEFSDYVGWVCNPASRLDIKETLIDMPITEMLPVECVDYWLDFEKLNEGWQSLGETLQIPLPPLIKRNASLQCVEPGNAYDSSLSLKIYKRFRSDFEQFGYSPGSWCNR
jgi:hypothetical protein